MAVTHWKSDQDFKECAVELVAGDRKPIAQVIREEMPGHSCAAKDSNAEPVD
jgi:hypothetical protein